MKKAPIKAKNESNSPLFAIFLTLSGGFCNFLTRSTSYARVSYNMKTLKPILILFIFFFTSSFSEIYKWIDEKGVTHYSESKPEMITVEEIHIKSYNKVTLVNNDEAFKLANKHNNKKLNHPKKVIMYSAEWCGVCKKAKKYFKKENIRYISYDIEKSKSAKARYKKLGAKGIPVIFVGKNA